MISYKKEPVGLGTQLWASVSGGAGLRKYVECWPLFCVHGPRNNPRKLFAKIGLYWMFSEGSFGSKML